MHDICHQNIPLFVRKLNYRITGTGPCVIFLHGYLETSRIWSSVSELFTGHTVIIPELIFSDNYSLPENTDMISFSADVIHSLVTELGFDNYSIVGNSMGGYIAFEMMRKYQSFIERVVLISTNPFSDNDEKRKKREREIGLLKKGRKGLVVAALLNGIPDDNIRELYSEMTKKLKTGNLISAQLSMSHRPDNTGLLRSSEIDILMIYGEKDETIPVDQLRELLKNSSAGYCEIPGGTHFVLSLNQNEAEKCIADFFDL